MIQMTPIVWEWPREWRATIDSQFTLSSSSLNTESPYTGETTPYGPKVQRFVAKLTFPDMRPREHRRVQGWLTRLRGMIGLVRMVDYHRMRPAYDQFDVRPGAQSWSDGTWFSDSSGWVDGYLPPAIVAAETADEGACSLVVSGLPPSLPRPLGLGDLFEVRPNGIPANHGHLYEVVQDARSDADGRARLTFEPPLRRGVAAGDMIVLRYPSSVFRLASDGEGVMSRRLSSIGSIGLTLREVTPWQ